MVDCVICVTEFNFQNFLALRSFFFHYFVTSTQVFKIVQACLMVQSPKLTLGFERWRFKDELCSSFKIYVVP